MMDKCDRRRPPCAAATERRADELAAELFVGLS